MKRAAVGLTLAAAVSMTHWPVGFPDGPTALNVWFAGAATALAMSWVITRAASRPISRILLGLLLGLGAAFAFLPLLPANSGRAAFEAAAAMSFGVAILPDQPPSLLRDALNGLVFGSILTPAVVAILLHDRSEPFSSPIAGAAAVPMACAAIGVINHMLHDAEFDIAFSGFTGLISGIWLGWPLGCAGLAILPWAGFGIGLFLACRRIALEDPWNHATARKSASRS